MTNNVRIKRRAVGGAPGAPASLQNGELAFNEVDKTLYYGWDTGGAGGTATAVIAIGGAGAFVDKTSAQTIIGAKTFTSPIDGNVLGSAAKWTTPRTLSLTGDAAATLGGVDGSGNVSAVLTLADVNANVGSYTLVSVNAKGQVTAASAAHLNNIVAPLADYSFATRRLINLGAPIAANDAATKGYVDAVAQGIDAKQSVAWATTANIALSGLATQAGGEWSAELSAGQRILVKNQTDPAENGLYLAAADAWTRSADANTWDALVNAFTFVEQGATLADSGWVCPVNPGGTLGSSPISWTQFSGAGQIVAGAGLSKTGNQLDVTTPLAALAALSPAADRLPYYTGSAAAALAIFSAYARSLLAALDAAAARTTLGLGTLATQNADAVAITGGTLSNVTIDCGTF